MFQSSTEQSEADRDHPVTERADALDTCKFCGTVATPSDEKNCASLTEAYKQTPARPYGCPWFTKEYRARAAKPSRDDVVERCDEAVCKFDGMFRDIFNVSERHDIIRIILAEANLL